MAEADLFPIDSSRRNQEEGLEEGEEPQIAGAEEEKHVPAQEEEERECTVSPFQREIDLAQSGLAVLEPGQNMRWASSD